MKVVLNGLLATPSSVEQGFPETTSRNGWTPPNVSSLHTGRLEILNGHTSQECVVQCDSVSLALPLCRVLFFNFSHGSGAGQVVMIAWGSGFDCWGGSLMN